MSSSLSRNSSDFAPGTPTTTLLYTILPCSAPQAFSLSATRITQYNTWHLFLFHIVCSVCRLCAVDRGRRLSPFITCYLRCRFSSGLAHFRANRMHVCQRPQQLLHFSRLLDLQLSVACAKFVVVVLLLLLLLFLMHRPKGD